MGAPSKLRLGGVFDFPSARKASYRRCPRFATLTWAYPDSLLQPRIPRHRMTRLIRVRHQLLVHRARHIGRPIPGCLRQSHNSNEDHCDPSRKHPRRHSSRRRSQSRQRHLQRAVRRTHRHALQTPGALGRPDRQQLIYRQCRRTSLGTLRAINARRFIPPDAVRAEHRR